MFHTKNLIDQNQHGFVPGRSTCTNLSVLTQFLSESLDEQLQIDVAYTDFSKAFDRLDHNLLLKKLNNFGISDSLSKLFKSYLSDRLLFVECKGNQSETFTMPSGVPQGSILGPLFFNLFINDIGDKLNVNYLLYADDLKLFAVIRSLDDCYRLQMNLEVLHEWCISNMLPLNLSKCNVMTYTRKVSEICFPYNIDNVLFNRPKTFKDLGVLFDRKLYFDEHIFSTSASAYKMLGFVIRNAKDFSDCDTLKLLFTSLVRSRLEYCSVVWCPIYDIYVSNLETVQRKFLKFLSFKINDVYPPRGYPQEQLLENFNMYSLSSRRECHSVVFLFKILNGFIDCAILLSQVNFNVPRLTSRNPLPFNPDVARTNVLVSSPIHTICRNYTNISESIDLFDCTVSEIKSFYFQ